MGKRAGMGEVHAQITVKGPRGAKRMRLLVDTGSTFTWIRASRLRELGIRPLEEYPFDTVQGQAVTRPVGEGRVQVQHVVFPAHLWSHHQHVPGEDAEVRLELVK